MFSETFEQAPVGGPVISWKASKAEGGETVTAPGIQIGDSMHARCGGLFERVAGWSFQHRMHRHPPSYPQSSCAGGWKAAALACG